MWFKDLVKLTFRATRCERRSSGKGKTHHRIALPYHDMIRLLDGIDVAWQVLVDLVGSVASDKGDLPRDSVGIDHYGCKRSF
jgi:hypothetical protein